MDFASNRLGRAAKCIVYIFSGESEWIRRVLQWKWKIRWTERWRYVFFFSAAHFKSAWPRRLCRCLISWNYTQALQCFIQQNFTEYKCTNTRTEIWFTSVYNFFSYCSTLHSFVVNIHGPLIYFTVKWICITWHHSIYRINASLFGSA